MLNTARQPLEIFVDDETKLTLHGLQQYYLKLEEKEKNRKLNDLLDNLEFNQVRGISHRISASRSYSSTGLHLREVSAAGNAARCAASGVQLPFDLHSLRSASA